MLKKKWKDLRSITMSKLIYDIDDILIFIDCGFKLYGKIVTLKNVGTEKYGRVLADVYLNEESITEWLLINDYGVPYDGGVKVRPESWGVIEN